MNISKSSLKTPVNIYGSGISGLVTAYNFLKLGFLDINVFTKGRGIIQSLQTEEGVVEFAANSILQNQAVTDLLNDFEIEYEYYSSLGKKKFIFHEDNASRWPLTKIETFKSFLPLLKLSRKSKSFKPNDFETINDWSKRTVGSLLSKRLIEIGLKGIYGPNTENLSASLCLGGIFDKTKSKPSKGSISFKNGMGSFIKRLENELSISGVKFNTLKEGESLEEKREGINIVCTPSHSLPSFVKTDFSEIEYHSISMVTYILDEDYRLPFKGFGCLFPENDEGVLGVILNSDLFDNRAPKGKVSETWILKGELYKEELSLSTLEGFREKNFNRSFDENKVSYFKHWSKAFPVYSVQLEKALKKINNESDVYFFGNWTGKIGIGRLIEESPSFVKNILREFSSTKKR